jgi:hypothetical protein
MKLMNRSVIIDHKTYQPVVRLVIDWGLEAAQDANAVSPGNANKLLAELGKQLHEFMLPRFDIATQKLLPDVAATQNYNCALLVTPELIDDVVKGHFDDDALALTFGKQMIKELKVNNTQHIFNNK